MERIDAQNMALSLMRAHGLEGWTFRFNRAKRLLGLCNHDRRRIELSDHFVLRNGEPAVRDTILHEIAHALVGAEAGHGPAWRSKCREIGARPERLDHEAEMPQGPWRATCPGCGNEYFRHRRPARNRRYACRACGMTRGVLSFRLRA